MAAIQRQSILQWRWCRGLLHSRLLLSRQRGREAEKHSHLAPKDEGKPGRERKGSITASPHARHNAGRWIHGSVGMLPGMQLPTTGHWAFQHKAISPHRFDLRWTRP